MTVHLARRRRRLACVRRRALRARQSTPYRLPVHMQPLDVVLIVVLGVAVATLATLYPAVQASRLFPIEAIRSE